MPIGVTEISPPEHATRREGLEGRVEVLATFGGYFLLLQFRPRAVQRPKGLGDTLRVALVVLVGRMLVVEGVEGSLGPCILKRLYTVYD